MADLPHPWGAYARLQGDLSRRHRADGPAWGIEEALNRILRFDNTVTPITQADIDRAVASGARRERSRASLRTRYAIVEAELLQTTDTAAVVEVRQELALLEALAGGQDWALLCAVAEGRRYAEIAVQTHVSPGSLRARVLRLRRTFAAAAAA
jgi:sigma-70-like protein